MASPPWRAAAIQSSSSWNQGRGNTHDTPGVDRSPCAPPNMLAVRGFIIDDAAIHGEAT